MLPWPNCLGHTYMARRRKIEDGDGEGAASSESFGFYDYHDIRVPIVFGSRQLGTAKILTKNGQAKTREPCVKFK